MVVVDVEVCFLSELEQNVEQSKKDYETLKEESESREKELTQVRSHMWSKYIHSVKIPLQGVLVFLSGVDQFI